MMNEPALSSRLLITGAAGFLGANIASAASQRGWTVLAGNRSKSDLQRLTALAPAAEPTSFDIAQSSDALSMLLAELRPDAIIHSAAYGVDYRQQDMEAAVAVNILATLRLVEAAAAAGVKRFIQVGTAYEYGSSPTPLSETSPLNPTSLYGATKAAATVTALERAAARGLPLAVVRPFGMYGRLEGGHKLVPLMIRSCLDGRPLELTPGNQLRDYTFVGDIAEACLDLAATDDFPAGSVFNLGSGAPVTLRALGEAVAAVVGRGGNSLIWGAKAYRPDEVMVIAADVAFTRERLGWRAQTSLESGLRKTLEFELMKSASEACDI